MAFILFNFDASDYITYRNVYYRITVLIFLKTCHAATNPGDLVVMNPVMAAAPPDASVATGNDQKEADRKHWGAPGGTVLNVLQSAQLTDTASSDLSEVGSVEGAADADRTKVAKGQDGSPDSKEGR